MADYAPHSGITRWSLGSVGPTRALTAIGDKGGEWQPKQHAGFDPQVEYRYGQWQGIPRTVRFAFP